MMLLGNINAIPFRRRFGGGDGTPFPYIPGMIARYSGAGLTNEQMAANPVWVDKTGNGHDLQMKNFAWGGMSGCGGYSLSKETFSYTPDIYSFNFTDPEGGLKIFDVYFQLIGLEENSGVTFNLDIRESGTAKIIKRETYTKDGIYHFEYKSEDDAVRLYMIGYNGVGEDRTTFTVKILPYYAGALVFDGVDDYGICDNFPILTKEKGYTVVALRQWISNKMSSTFIHKGTLSSEGAFIFEFIRSTGEENVSSFGKATITDISKKAFSYQTSNSYNGVSITSGNKEDGNVLHICRGVYGNYTNIAIWELIILDHDATEEELTKIKDYFVKTYPWLFPDQAWTVTGKTNEDEDRATIANITGNGNDLVLSNFGFAEGSGYNEEGEYAGYLVTDGVDDKIASSAFEMGKDFTVVGEWELLPVSNYNYAGIVKSNNLYVYNSSTGIQIYVCSSSAGNKMEGLKSLKAICSDGRVYDDNWVEYKLKNVGDNIGFNTTLDIGTNKNNFTKIAFKNLEIYNNKILSKDDCIKAYNYLQTLKAQRIPPSKNYILKEDGGYVLQEDGNKILTEQQ